MIKLLIADDEDLLRGALAALLDLEDDLTVAAQASTGTEAVRLAREHRPDIAVLDLEMPPADGLHAAEQIRAELPTRIILVTRHARPGVLRRALAAGVSGFVPKTTPSTRLAEIVRDVAAGRRYVDPDIAASALTEDDCPLTARELEVLRASRTGARSTRSPRRCTSLPEPSATTCRPPWRNWARTPGTPPHTTPGKKAGSDPSVGGTRPSGQDSTR